MTDSRDLPAARRFAWILGLAGLLPFFTHAFFAWLVPPSEMSGVLRSQVHYAAAILTFLGALHWGVTLATPSLEGGAAAGRMVWSVVPSLWCWVVTLYPIDLALPLLTAGLAVALGVDLMLYRGGLVPAWFRGLRIVLSVGAIASVGASWLALSVRLSSAVR